MVSPPAPALAKMSRLAFMVSAIVMCSLLSKVESLVQTFAHNAAQSSYTPAPAHLELISVAVFHRHGDRSQVSRSPGPAFPHDVAIDELWISRMPSAESLAIMAAAASDEAVVTDPAAQEVEDRDIVIDRAVIDALPDLYSGWERANYPYGMLTEQGVQEMRAVGAELRRRYVGSLLAESGTVSADSIYARSTNFCRTKQSLRSLLAGVLGLGEGEGGIEDATKASKVPTKDRIQLRTVEKRQETMFPQAGGPCPAIAMRRAELYADNYVAELFTNYTELEELVDTSFGYSAAGATLNWMTVREVIVCQSVHSPEMLPEWVTESVVSQVDQLGGFMWKRLFGDRALNQLAIGRFVHDMTEIVDAAVRDPHKKTKLMVWSGHDSTLVPMLCALGIEDDGWPPYASHLEIEFAKDADGDIFVRAIYNNEERTLGGCDALWCPYFRFKRRMRELALTADAYTAQCGVGEAGDGAMEAEIRATTGGN